MGKFDELTGKIFKTKKIKFFNGLCPNRFGNVSYFLENGVIVNNSIRNIYIGGYDKTNNEIMYYRIIDKNEYDTLINKVKELNGFGMFIEKNSFNGLITGNFVIMFDIVYLINANEILKLLELNNNSFCAIPNDKDLLVKIALKNWEIYTEQKDWIIMEKINENKLFQEPIVKNIKGEKMFYNNIADVEYFGLKMLKKHKKNQNLLFI